MATLTVHTLSREGHSLPTAKLTRVPSVAWLAASSNFPRESYPYVLGLGENPTVKSHIPACSKSETPRRRDGTFFFLRKAGRD